MSDLSICLLAVDPAVFGWGGVVIAAGLLVFGLRANHKKRLIDNIPTSKTAGVFIGLVEIKGTAEAEHPISSYLTESRCVYYSWTVEESWSRTETETYTDSEGKTKTRTVHKSGWKTVDSDKQHIPFYLRDDCGVIRVNPDGAKIQAETALNHGCGPGDPMYYGKGPAHSIMDSDHRRRFIERTIPLHDNLYIMGHARLREDVVAPEIAHDRHAGMFLISTKSEEQISGGLTIQFWAFGIAAVVLAGLGWLVGGRAAGVNSPDVTGTCITAAAIATGVWAVGWVWVAYNSMIDLRQRVRQGWSNVDVQLKRRTDLIPQLVNVVKGLRDYEKTVHQSLAELRNQMNVTAPGEAGEDAKPCAQRLIAIKEAYPELKTSDAFGNLQASLVETEQRIALARTYFNEIATHYNIRLQIIPDRFISAMARLKPHPLITAANFERAVVEVNLAD